MTERDHIKRLIRIARFSEGPSEVNQFFNLEIAILEPWIHNLDLNKNEDLWQEFKQVLQEHPLLEEGEEAYRILDQPDMVEKGYWWYDPENWK